MMEQKRRPALLLDHGSIISSTVKRQKKQPSLSTKERKDKVGDRVAALQQLVSPFGKTDTASVLCEAMEYINFLHDQLKALSAPYLLTTPTGIFPDSQQQQFGLRSQGLCLVPISCTLGIARSNGADIWAPIKHTSPTI